MIFAAMDFNFLLKLFQKLYGVGQLVVEMLLLTTLLMISIISITRNPIFKGNVCEL